MKKIAKYALLPGFLPRVGRLATAVHHMMFCFISILAATGLINANHPCARVENIGRYRFSHVLLMAWHDLKFSRDNIPRILMFFAVVGTIAMLCMMFITIIIKSLLFIGMANAQTTEYFQTARLSGTGVQYDADKDWIFLFLERIFGNTGFIDFWTSSSHGVQNMFFSGLFRGLISAYSAALFSLAIIMIIYLLVMTLVDAAKTGKPFGKRFDSIWAPIRFAIALFLLMPITGSQYNVAHMAVFQVSEWSTHLANNLWFRAVASMAEEDTRQTDPTKKKNATSFVAPVSVDPGYRFVRDVFLIHLCSKGQNLLSCRSDDEKIDLVTMKVGASQNSILYQFGVPGSYDYCGSIEMPMLHQVPLGAPGNNPEDSDMDVMNYLPNKILDGYIAAVDSLTDPSSEMSVIADKMVVAYAKDKYANFIDIADSETIQKWIDEYTKIIYGFKDDKPFALYEDQLGYFNRWIVRLLEQDARLGWGAAGVFYMRIANSSAMINKVAEQFPKVKTYPVNLTRRYATPNYPSMTNAQGWWYCQMEHYIGDQEYCSTKSGPQVLYGLLDKGNAWFRQAPMEKPVVYDEMGMTEYDDSLRITQKEVPEEQPGHDSLFQSIAHSVSKNLHMDNHELHPLGAVVNWGHNFMKGSGTAFAIAMAGSALSGVVKILTAGAVNIGTPLVTIGTDIGMLLFIAGFVLAFILPMLPCIYFMFAVIEWIASIMEAVVGAPLWALSFITMEGDLLGKGVSGIKMFFEILLRPIFILLGLLLSILVFTAGVTFVNEAYALFMSGYHDANGQHIGAVSSFTIQIASSLIYAFVIYAIALSSFKLIDQIPDRFVRWLNLPKGFSSNVRMGMAQVRDALIGAALYQQFLGIFTNKK